jgi:hypothetical protein
MNHLWIKVVNGSVGESDLHVYGSFKRSQTTYLTPFLL